MDMDFGLSQEEREELGEQQKKRDRELVRLRTKAELLSEDLFESEYVQVYFGLYIEVIARKLYLHGGQGSVSIEMTDYDGERSARLTLVNHAMTLREAYSVIERERGRMGNYSLPKALNFMDKVSIEASASGGIEVEVLKKRIPVRYEMS
ncbi:MAG: hypothetical protein HYV63_02240 [Candidatus Schekmanbacteria bacterium]|nr:hypothetical protein [Candidatus Schekmanbacteria bacterium]